MSQKRSQTRLSAEEASHATVLPNRQLEGSLRRLEMEHRHRHSLDDRLEDGKRLPHFGGVQSRLDQPHEELLDGARRLERLAAILRRFLKQIHGPDWRPVRRFT